MKRITTLILVIAAFGTAYSQITPGIRAPKPTKLYSENDTVPKVFYPTEHRSGTPLIELNGESTSMATLKTIQPDKIEEFEIEQGIFKVNDKEYQGKILITMKPGYNPKIVTLNELLSQYTTVKTDEPRIYSIDGEFINADDKQFTVDERNVMQIKVRKLDKIALLNGIYWIEILTRTPENLKEANTIWIRGTANKPAESISPQDYN